MLLDDYERVSQAPTPEALREALEAFAEHMDFPLVTSALVTSDRFVMLSNVPAASVEAIEAVDDAGNDPVMKQLKAQSTPVIWDQRTYVDAELGHKWEAQAPFGFRTGIALALHLPEGRRFLLGMDREKALPKRDARLTRMVADLHLLAVHAQAAALRLLVPTVSVPAVTLRELDILRLLVQGKSNKGIANTLQVSDNTIEFHLKNLFRKLECKNRSSAIVKAFQYGLL